LDRRAGLFDPAGEDAVAGEDLEPAHRRAFGEREGVDGFDRPVFQIYERLLDGGALAHATEARAQPHTAQADAVGGIGRVELEAFGSRVHGAPWFKLRRSDSLASSKLATSGL